MNIVQNNCRTCPNSRAVSPIIGTILIVAIVILLSAIIGTFLLASTDGITTGTQAGVELDDQPGGGTGVATVTTITIGSAESVEVSATVVDGGQLEGGASESETLEGAGDSVTFVGDNDPDEFDVRIIATAEAGGDEAVLLNRVVTL